MGIHETRGYEVERSDLEPLLTTAQVCAALQVSKQTLWRIVGRGELVPVRVSRSPRFRPSDVERYLDRGGDAMRDLVARGDR